MFLSHVNASCVLLFSLYHMQCLCVAFKWECSFGVPSLNLRGVKLSQVQFLAGFSGLAHEFFLCSSRFNDCFGQVSREICVFSWWSLYCHFQCRSKGWQAAGTWLVSLARGTVSHCGDVHTRDTSVLSVCLSAPQLLLQVQHCSASPVPSDIRYPCRTWSVL